VQDAFVRAVPRAGRPPPRGSVAACIALGLLAAPAARAEDEPAFTIGSRPAWLVLGGVTTGGTIALGDRGALVGGELSVARLRDGDFVGLYADGYYDWGADATYATGGLELGRRLLGVDGGVALRLSDGETQLGATGRVTVGLGVAGVYARYAHFWDAMNDDNVIQIGLILKLPLWTGGTR
jgi:hypothetical protein